MTRKQSKSAMWGRSILMISAIILSTGMAFAGTHNTSPKLSRDLVAKTSSDKVDVIVQFTQVPTARHHQKIVSRGGALKRELGRFKGAAYRMPASKLADLANDPEVAYISPDRPLHGASNGPMLDYHNETVNAPAAWAQGLDGTGVGVAVIDSGIAGVSDLNASNVVFSQDFTGLGSTADQYGHGTHVAGIIAGNGAASIGPNDFYTFQGIAQNASLVSLRVLDANGAGTDSEVIAAIQAAIQLKSLYNIRVINLSVGRPVFESYQQDPLCQATEQAWQAGIVVVVAAGNYGRDNNAGTNGYGTITAPGNDPYVITVGAMNTEGTADRTDDVPASYSSKGPSLLDQVVKPDLVAPGNSIISLYTPGETLLQELPNNVVPTSLYLTNGSAAASDTYFALSGTSMATPMVSGAVALMAQQNPALSPDQIKFRLMLTAFKGLVQSSTASDATTGETFTEQADVLTVGAGYLDIQAALADDSLAPAAAGSALSPTAAVDAEGNVVLVATGQSVLGNDGTGILWGSNVAGVSGILWGSGLVTNDGILWGSAITAGDGILWGSGITTGDGILWGSSTMTLDGILWGSGLLVNDGILWGSGVALNDGILWGSQTSFVDQVGILWGSQISLSDQVGILWGSGSSQVDGMSVLWGSGTTVNDK